MVKLWVLLLACIVAFCGVVVTGDDNAPSLAPSTDCTMIIYDMADCIPFLSNGSEETKPDSTCCSGFETVLKTDAECICEALHNSAQLGIDLNLTKAMTLPAACGLSESSLSNCGFNPPDIAPTAPAPAVNPPYIAPATPTPVVPTPPIPPAPAVYPPYIAPTTPTPVVPTPSITEPPTIAAAPSTTGQAPAPSPAASGAHSSYSSIAVIVCAFVTLSSFMILA